MDATSEPPNAYASKAKIGADRLRKVGKRMIGEISPARTPTRTETRTSFGSLTRSELMSRCRSAGNQTTEVRMLALLRKVRITGWRRHLPLPGKPDFAWRREKVAIFVDGCFWHGHDCGRNLTPKSNAAFWRQKISNNQARDRKATRMLRQNGWTVIRVWECVLRRQPRSVTSRIQRALGRSLKEI
jgi:DNA mismatch endonuclease (patch repair protein)